MAGAPQTGASRAVLVHYHIYKNAGTSLDFMLERSFGPRWAKFDKSEPGAIVLPAELADFVRQCPDVLAVSSHQCRPPVPNEEGIAYFPLFVLRHPLDRAESIYRFERKQELDEEGSRQAKRLKLPDYIRWRLGGSQDGVMRNFQVLYLTDALSAAERPWSVRAQPDHLAQAQAFLLSLPAFGLVERFEESLQLFQHWLAPQFPAIRFFQVRQNVTSSAELPLEERLARLRSELGDEVYHWLEAENALELRLYDFAVRLFEERISARRHLEELAAAGARALARMEPYVPGETLRFGAADRGPVYFIDGWAEPEAGGTWTLGPVARLGFSLCADRETRAGPFRIVFRGRTVPLPDGAARLVRVKCGASQIAEWKLGAKIQEFAAEVPAHSTDAGDQMTLEFSVDDVRSPRELGLSDDVRPLGVFAFSLRILPAVAPAGEKPRAQ